VLEKCKTVAPEEDDDEVEETLFALGNIENTAITCENDINIAPAY